MDVSGFTSSSVLMFIFAVEFSLASQSYPTDGLSGGFLCPVRRTEACRTGAGKRQLRVWPDGGPFEVWDGRTLKGVVADLFGTRCHDHLFALISSSVTLHVVRLGAKAMRFCSAR